MSLEPNNSSLTKPLGERSHALLIFYAENPLSGSSETGIPKKNGKHDPDEGHHVVFKGSTSSVPMCSLLLE